MGWQDELKRNIKSIDELTNYIDINPDELDQLREVEKIHPISISRYYLSLIDPKDPKDPIRRMVVPTIQELDTAGDYDPSDEQSNVKTVGLQHKYEQTGVILATNRCASYCRHCFRKRMVGLPAKEILENFDNALDYIKEHSEINNVLVTGGDPLILPTTLIRGFLERLSEVPRLDFVRFGSRVPVTFPQRFTDDKELTDLLKEHSRQDRRLFIVNHFNHPREITQESKDAVQVLLDSNVIMNNQTVLLKGVNDNPETLAELLNELVSTGINPYYVFQCRPVSRVKNHLQVPLVEGYEIVEEAKKKLSGHSKRFRYAMSHRLGKVETVAIDQEERLIWFKFFQSKYPENHGKFFKRKLNDTGGWLDDFEEI